jgi:hypothetical protein
MDMHYLCLDCIGTSQVFLFINDDEYKSILVCTIQRFCLFTNDGEYIAFWCALYNVFSYLLMIVNIFHSGLHCAVIFLIY